MSNLIGQSLGRYHVIEQLGEGGMAIVYKAYDTRLEADVAVKVIRTERLAPDILQRAMKRFEREAKSLAQLTHPNLVKVLDYGEFEGRPYLVMPYLPGGTLKQMMKGQSMPWQEAARLLIPVARALDYAHKRNLIHRDVKPSNILITESGEPMLTDFGVAKIIDEESTVDLTGTSAAVGTPEYMAPEQATSKNVDHRADIYALGIVLYEMVTGRRPFQADTPLAVLFKQASEPLPRPSQFMPGLPEGVEKILIKMLAKSPVDRYQSMGEIVHALESQLSGVVPAMQPQPSRPAKPMSPPEKEPDTQAIIDQNEGATVQESRSHIRIPHKAARPPQTTIEETATVQDMEDSTSSLMEVETLAGKRKIEPGVWVAGIAAIALIVYLISLPKGVVSPSLPTHPETGVVSPSIPTETETMETQGETAPTRVFYAQQTLDAVKSFSAATKDSLTATKTALETICHQSTEQCFEVIGKSGWQKTRFYISAGQTLLIQYSFGNWSSCADWGCLLDEDARGVAGGAGLDLNYPDNFISGCVHNALIARISNSTPFCVSASFYGEILQSGYLELRGNDNIYEDNGGSITVYIEVK
jgi:serine/threonine protein kinase